MKLLTTEEIDALPNLTALRSINGKRAVKGLDFL
jgi:hypothetical protein